MAANTQMTSMNEGLQKILQDVGLCFSAPDADMQFLQTLQLAVVQRMKQGAGQPGQPGQPPQPGMGGGQPPGMGGPPGSMPPGTNLGGPGGAQPQQSPGVPGVRSMPTMPNPDELRRIVAQMAG